MKKQERKIRKERQGFVVSNKMDKSVVVSEVKKIRHSIYGKFIKKTKKYVVHDIYNKCLVGDKVRIMETRPLSKTKKWRLIEVLERAK